ncbi:MAG: hypothetical protein KY468_07185 [Armatimonadetes bacterium]|nr:hypothetical protein [Armatimonadota bacterium]
MRKWILTALAAVALTTASGGAIAQTEEQGTPWAIRLGAFWPTDGNLRNFSDNVWFNAGIDYTLRSEDFKEWIGALDYGSASGINAWMFQVIHKWHDPDQPYSFGIGAGLYTFDPVTGRQTEYGVPLVLDWNFTRNLFLEGKYHWVVSDVDFSGITAQLGYRF